MVVAAVWVIGADATEATPDWSGADDVSEVIDEVFDAVSVDPSRVMATNLMATASTATSDPMRTIDRRRPAVGRAVDSDLPVGRSLVGVSGIVPAQGNLSVSAAAVASGSAGCGAVGDGSAGGSPVSDLRASTASSRHVW